MERRRNGLEEGEAGEDRMKIRGNGGSSERGSDAVGSSPPRFQTVIQISGCHACKMQKKHFYLGVWGCLIKHFEPYNII